MHRFWTAIFLLASTTSLVGCKDVPLEGPLKSCQIYITYPSGDCTLCGDAYLDGERLNTENFVVLKSDKKEGYTQYDDWAAELCNTFFTASELQMHGVIEKTSGCAELGYTETDLFTFSNGETVEYNHDGSCTAFTEPLTTTGS